MGLSFRGQRALITALSVTVLALGAYTYVLHSRLDLIGRQIDAQSARVETGLRDLSATEGVIAQQLGGLKDSVAALQGDWAAVSGRLSVQAAAVAAQLDTLTVALGTGDGPEGDLLAQVREARARLEGIQAQIANANMTGLKEDLERRTAEMQTLSAAVSRIESEAAAIRDAWDPSLFNPVALFNQTKDSVVTVYMDGIVAGTGFVLGEERRHVVTAWHVLEAAYPPGGVTVSVQTYDGYRTAARFVRTSAQQDLVLLELDNTLHQVDPLKLADPTSFVVGQPVMAIGNPLRFQWSASTGIITRLNHIPDGVFKDTPCKSCANLVQFDGVIATGNSGGPLLNARGEVVGMVSFGATSDEINFAVPSNLIQTLIDSIVKS